LTEDRVWRTADAPVRPGGHDRLDTPNEEDVMPGPIVVGLALDDRDAAPMALGRLLARVSGGSLALVHAYPYEPLTVPLPEYEDELRDNSLAALRRAAEHLGGEFEVTVHAHARISAAYGLHDAAERLGASAVVVGSSHRGRLGRVLTGGVAARLLHGAPCPVAVAPVDYAGPDEDSLRIAVAYDGRLESREALETAVALARGGRGTVSTVTVEEPVAVATSPMPPGWVGQREHAAARHLAAEGAVAEAHDRIPDDLRGSTDLLTGHAAEILSAVSADVDLMLCGSRGYGPVRAVLLGGVSSALAHRCACPLLVVPRGRAAGLAGGGGSSRTVAAPG
jgi:nucleotide-binding universal stress UspA family protein